MQRYRIYDKEGNVVENRLPHTLVDIKDESTGELLENDIEFSYAVEKVITLVNAPISFPSGSYCGVLADYANAKFEDGTIDEHCLEELLASADEIKINTLDKHLDNDSLRRAIWNSLKHLGHNELNGSSSCLNDTEIAELTQYLIREGQDSLPQN